MVVKYECDNDISINFYSKEYLDTVSKPKNGTASSLLISVKSDVELGIHGYKMRGCVKQTPLDADTHQLDVKLFSY